MKKPQTIEEELDLAQRALEGKGPSGMLARVMFRNYFVPSRVAELLQAYSSNIAHLWSMRIDHDRELMREREAREIAERRLKRAQALPARWRGMTPGIDNGWADELEEALNTLEDGIVAVAGGPSVPTGAEVEAHHNAVIGRA